MKASVKARQTQNKKDRTASVSVTLPASLRTAVKRESKRHKITRSAYVARCLAHCVATFIWTEVPKP